MSGFLCSMVGATFSVAAAGEVLRAKKGIISNGATVSTTQSKFGGSSANFNGSSHYLTVNSGSNSSFQFTGDFTVEMWVYQTSANNATYFDNRVGSNDLAVNFVSVSQKFCLASTGAVRITPASTFTLNAWHHIAVTRSGTTWTLWADGASQGTWEGGSGSTSNPTSINIGRANDGGGAYFTGYMDEVRVSNSARYTTGFTPSTTPFISDANTLLLIHANGNDTTTFFEDDNGLRRQVYSYMTGSSSVSATQNKFGGSSFLVGGTGDNAINVRYDTYNYNDWGSKTAYTMEAWVYPTDWANLGATGEGSASIFVNSRENGYVRWGFGFNNAGKLTLNYSTSGSYGTTTQQESTTSGTLNTWQHIAMVKNGSTVKCYYNGVEKISFTFSGTLATSGSEWFRIGGWGGGQTAYIDEIRVSDTVRYTTGFTPSTTPFVNDANTLILWHGDGVNSSKIYRDDNGARTQIGLQSVNSTAISTTQSKFGGTSGSFNNTNQQIVSPGTVAPVNFTSGNFTIEGWIYPTSHTSTILANCEYLTRNGYWIGNWDNGALLFGSVNSSNTAVNYRSSGTGYINLNAWNHFAVCRNGTTIEIFVNGTRRYTATDFNNINSSAGPLSLGFGWGQSSGLYQDTNAVNYFGGYMDEIRISNTVRYTGSTYTEPTAQFQNDANTVFLCHFDGTSSSTVFFDDNGIAPYTP